MRRQVLMGIVAGTVGVALIGAITIAFQIVRLLEQFHRRAMLARNFAQRVARLDLILRIQIGQRRRKQQRDVGAAQMLLRRGQQR